MHHRTSNSIEVDARLETTLWGVLLSFCSQFQNRTKTETTFTTDNHQPTTMYFVQRPTTLFHPYILASPSTKYVIPVFGPEEEASTSGNSSESKSSKQTEESKLAVSKPKQVVRYGSNVNVTEEEESWILSVDMPGVKSDDVTIEEKAGNLKVEADRKNGVRYEQLFSLDPKKADLSKLSAELADGVLTLTVPKKAPVPPVSIPLSSEEPPEIDDKHFCCTMDLPGVTLASLKLDFKDDKLFLHAERKRMGAVGKIERVVQIQSGANMAQGKAYLSDGVLTVVAPRVVGQGSTETHKIKVGGITESPLKPTVETIEEGA